MKRFSFLTLATLLVVSPNSGSSRSFGGFDMPVLKHEVQTIDINQRIDYKKLPTVALKPVSEDRFSQNIESIYTEAKLAQTDLSFETFEKAMLGYFNLETKLNNKHIITIVDFDRSSKGERLFVIDIKAKKLLFHSLVAHGKNSGFDIPNKFSNNHRSLQSSLGFYITAETYTGHFGYAMRLDGMESGFNSNARSRGIVMHGANYVNTEIIKSQNRLGRSYGCPAIPYSIHKDVINTIKGGTLFFINKSDNNYLAKTKLLDDDSARKAYANSDNSKSDNRNDLVLAK